MKEEICVEVEANRSKSTPVIHCLHSSCQEKTKTVQRQLRDALEAEGLLTKIKKKLTSEEKKARRSGGNIKTDEEKYGSNPDESFSGDFITRSRTQGPKPKTPSRKENNEYV